MEIKYTIKTILNNRETTAKYNKGARIFEIQLLEDFLKDSFDIKKSFNNFNKKNIDVKTIHAPLSPSKLDNGCIYLESLTNDVYKKYFLKACELANLFANYYNHPIKVIIHNGFRLNTYLLIPSLIEEIIKIMNDIIDKYPRIIIEIENTTPMTDWSEEKVFFTSGILDENADIVDYLNIHCKKPIFRTVFDVCHYLTSIKMIKILSGIEYDLEDLFKRQKNILGTIHFANLRNLGTKEGEHGCGYKKIPEDIELLKNLLRYIEKYAKSADICMEITEKDYNNIPDVLETIEIIELIKKGEL